VSGQEDLFLDASPDFKLSLQSMPPQNRWSPALDQNRLSREYYGDRDYGQSQASSNQGSSKSYCCASTCLSNRFVFDSAHNLEDATEPICSRYASYIVAARAFLSLSDRFSQMPFC